MGNDNWIYAESERRQWCAYTDTMDLRKDWKLYVPYTEMQASQAENTALRAKLEKVETWIATECPSPSSTYWRGRQSAKRELKAILGGTVND